MTDKRYEVLVDNGLDISLKDNLTQKYPFNIVCENIDDFENILQEVLNCRNELNRNWEQTLRFEQYLKHNSEMIINYEEKMDELKNENRQLKQKIKGLTVEHSISDEGHTYKNNILSEENEHLKLQLDYIQSSITEAIKHSKTELEQKALKKVIEDYNEYMLGHKELSE